MSESQGVEVPFERIEPAVLRRLVEEFVTREGTDYGPVVYDLETKVKHVMGQLRRGDAVVTFDPRLGTATIASRRS